MKRSNWKRAVALLLVAVLGGVVAPGSPLVDIAVTAAVESFPIDQHREELGEVD